MAKLEVDVRYIIVGARIAGAQPGDELIVHNDVVIGIRPRHAPPNFEASPAGEIAHFVATGGHNVASSMSAAEEMIREPVRVAPATVEAKVRAGKPKPPPLEKFVSEESKTYVWDLLTAKPDGLTMRKLADAYRLDRSDTLSRQRLRNVIDMMLRQKHVKPNPDDMEKEVRYPRYLAI